MGMAWVVKSRRLSSEMSLFSSNCPLGLEINNVQKSFLKPTAVSDDLFRLFLFHIYIQNTTRILCCTTLPKTWKVMHIQEHILNWIHSILKFNRNNVFKFLKYPYLLRTSWIGNQIIKRRTRCVATMRVQFGWNFWHQISNEPKKGENDRFCG